MPRRAYEPTKDEREAVEMCVASGLSEEQICKLIPRPYGREKSILPIAIGTLRKHYQKELTTGVAVWTKKVVGTVLATATDKTNPRCITAATFYLEHMAGWKKTVGVEQSGSVGLDFTLDGATDKELEVISKFLRRKAGDDARDAAANEAA